MKYVILILKYLGFTLLGLLGLLLLALILPLTVRLHYEGGVFTLNVRVLFFWIPVIPRKKDGRTKRGKARKETEQAPQDAPEKKKGGVDVRLIFDLLSPSKRFLKRALRSIRIRDVSLRLIAHGGEMAETGIAAGRMWAAIGAGTAALNNVFRISYKEIVVVPDFTDQYAGKETFDCKVTAIPVILIVAAIGLLFRVLAILPKTGDGTGRKQPDENRARGDQICREPQRGNPEAAGNDDSNEEKKG